MKNKLETITNLFEEKNKKYMGFRKRRLLL